MLFFIFNLVTITFFMFIVFISCFSQQFLTKAQLLSKHYNTLLSESVYGELSQQQLSNKSHILIIPPPCFTGKVLSCFVRLRKMSQFELKIMFWFSIIQNGFLVHSIRITILQIKIHTSSLIVLKWLILDKLLKNIVLKHKISSQQKC